jgi:hypothetical protein
LASSHLHQLHPNVLLQEPSLSISSHRGSKHFGRSAVFGGSGGRLEISAEGEVHDGIDLFVKGTGMTTSQYNR